MHLVSFCLSKLFDALMRLQAPEGTGGIWSASDVRVLGGLEGQDEAGDLNDA